MRNNANLETAESGLEAGPGSPRGSGAIGRSVTGFKLISCISRRGGTRGRTPGRPGQGIVNNK